MTLIILKKKEKTITIEGKEALRAYREILKEFSKAGGKGLSAFSKSGVTPSDLEGLNLVKVSGAKVVQVIEFKGGKEFRLYNGWDFNRMKGMLEKTCRI